MKEIHTDVLIIGCGITGLTASFWLKKNEVPFVAIDKLEQPGGVISTISENGFLYERGPNTGIVANTYVVELFDELSDNCTIEFAKKTVKKRYILKNNTLHHLPMGFLDAIKTPLFSFKDKIKILGEPFRSRGNNPHETLSDFVKRRLGQSFLDYAIEPFILGVYAGCPDYLVTKYAFPKLYNLEQKYGSLIMGSIIKKFQKKNETEKRVTAKVFSCKNGLTSLTNALYKKSDEKNFIFNACVQQVNKINIGFETVITTKSGEKIKIFSNGIISTIGGYALSNLFTFISKNEISKINNLIYAKVIEISVGFNNWKGIKLDGFGGLIPSKENRNILGILFMSSLFESRAPTGGALLAVFLGGVKRQELASLSDGEIKNIVEKECIELLGIPSFKPDLFNITRHNYAIPQYGVESGERLDMISEIETKHKGLFIGGNLRDGIGIADRIQQGYNLAKVFFS